MDAGGDFPADAPHRDIIDKFRAVRGFSEALAAPLSPEDQTVQSMADASPAKWHLAHTTWFFETFVLKAFDPAYQPFHEAYEVLFNSYYNGVGPQFHRPSRGVLSRPTVVEIAEYRDHVDSALAAFAEDTDGAEWAEAAPLIELGLNHEQQHQELLLTDIKHAMSFSPLHPVVYAGSEAAPAAEAPPPADWIDVPGGVHRIGWAGNSFAFDNEGPVHEVLLRPCQLAARPVTNGEFITFVEDGGYEQPLLWLSDGWATVQAQGWRHPIYWTRRDGVWHEYTLTGLKPVDPAAPVGHISFYEAVAFAEWACARLPTEFEWEVAARTLPVEGNFADSGAFHPRADAGAANGGLRQMFGDVWEWTQSAYGPYPGFRPAAGAVGEYNGKFMCNQMVLRGGSCASPARHVRPTYRNFFYPDARWQFSGFRLARDA